MFKVIGTDGQIYGPVTAEQLRKWIAQNRANGRTLIQPEASTEWKPLSEFLEFTADLQAAPPPPPAALAVGLPPLSGTVTVSERASNKIAAGVCGILLGGLGVHKFILGYTGTGIIMLVASVVGGFVTCGLSSCVLHIIGLIEGIIYLTKPDAEFVRVYVDGRREWF